MYNVHINYCIIGNLFKQSFELMFRFSNCGTFYTENVILSYERVTLLALHRLFGPEYFNPPEQPVIYCTPDPILFSIIKKTAVQVILKLVYY